MIFVFTALTSLKAYGQSTQFSLEKKPVWEAGLGVGYLSGIDYPGSKDPNTAQFALPFFIYRSSIFRVGDGGVGAVAVEEPRLKLDISLGGALNAEPEPDSVRAGMPDLDLLFGFGPRLQYKFLRKSWPNGSRSEITWDTKLRAIFSTDFESLQTRGFVLSSGFGLRQKDIIKDKVDFIVNADISFNDQRFNDYIYSVPAEFATDTRAAYTAIGGYTETRVFVGLALKPQPKLRIFTGLGLFNYKNSANEQSPLFETNSSVQYAVGVVWSALQSKQTIDVYSSD